MRKFFLLLIILVLAAIALVATGIIDINQLRGATPPTVTAADGRIEARPPQAPQFEVEVKRPVVTIGAEQRAVTVPTVTLGTEAKDAPVNSAAPAQR